MGSEDESVSLAPPAEQKYDRQIRIWGEHGQAALERAAVCVLGSGPTATETLKNLVLPGIGSFTIVDDAQLSAGDAGNNFFVRSSGDSSRQSSVSRAEAATRSLLQLNDRVDGAFVPEDVANFLSSADSAAAFFKRFSLVVATQVGTTDRTLRTVASGCLSAGVPLVVVRSYGLIGSLRIQVPEMCVLDAREDSMAADLRLYRPFSELEAFVDMFDFETLTDATAAAHVPFIVILLRALSKFRALHGKHLPSSRSEKDAFKNIVKEIRSTSSCPSDAENFEEALKYSNLRMCYADASAPPDNIASVLADPKADPERIVSDAAKGAVPASVFKLPTPIPISPRPNVLPDFSNVSGAIDMAENENASFWLHAAAVRAFAEANDGQLPVAGVVPDMTADTKSYVDLQRIYSAKAESDAAKVLAYALKISERRRCTCRVDESSVRDYCKRFTGVRVIRYRSLEQEATSPKGSSFLERVALEGASDASVSNSALSYYIILRAADLFHSEHGWFPGERDESVENDLRLLRDHVARVKGEYGGSILAPGLWGDETEEVLRFANGELHNVAAYMGGVAAQEAVKILTQQFVPVNNTLIVNFANLTSTSFEA